MQRLRLFQADRSLVALRRVEVDDKKIQGFVLGSSEQLVLLQYVYDFNLDGLMILRTSDISEVECSRTEVFQQQRLADEGLLSKVPFGYALNLDSWRTAIRGLLGAHSIFILECECLADPDFAIGRILEVGEEQVSLKYFTGAGNWEEDPVQFNYSDITSCQAGTNYANVYQRYFERVAP